jgi:tetratricopeptide (TPR) repeat protein
VPQYEAGVSATKLQLVRTIKQGGLALIVILKTVKSIFAFVAAMALVAMALVSCSPRKNNAATRKYQAFITRYNIHYNGETHYDETLKEMESNYADDYSRLLFIHPAAAKADTKAPQPQGSFDRSIEKAQKAIQLRSIKKKPKKQPGKSANADYKEWMRREEYNPFLHNSWLLMGRSQYMNGDFIGSASTFFYISKHFTWLPATVTEAKLSEARSYCAMDWLFEAESILTRIKEEQLTNKTVRQLYYTTYADFYVKSSEYEKAIPMLTEAIKLASAAQKPRLNFLLGQLYSLVGKKELAYKAFGKVGGSASVTYRAKFNARIKQSEVYTGTDIRPEVRALRRMVRYDRNKEYLDQIYYAIGNLYLTRGDTLNAIENYELAAKKSTRNGIDKAISQLTLGGLYFDLRKYSKAQPCYSEAIPQIPDTWPNYKMLRRRSDVLDELAIYSQNFELQDSLLHLSTLTEEQQLAIVNKIIDELKKKEKEEAEAAAREEFMANRDAQANNMQGASSQAPQTFAMNNGDDSWYFYNTSTKNAGRTEFQKKWGNRKLEDDWRRRNKASFNFNDFGGSDTDEVNADESDKPADDMANAEGDNGEEAVDKGELERSTDPHYPEYYLKQIPKTDEEKQTANDVIQEGLYNMGVILKDKLEDFPAAEGEFNTLLNRYPDNIYRLDTYYNLYLMYVRMGDMTKAEIYRNLILTNFPESNYGIAMRDPDYIGKLRRMMEVENELYDQALDAYTDNRNAEVHSAYKEFSSNYPLSKLMPKFMFIEALSYVTDRNTDKFKSTLMEMLERYPDTDLSPYASSYLKGLAQGKELAKGARNMRGMLWNTRLSNDSTATDGAGGNLEFDLNPNAKQYLVLLFPTDVISQNALLYNIARHNFTSFVVKDFDLEQMNFGRLGLLIIKGFDNVEEINHYRKVMAADTNLSLPAEVRPVVISADNFDTLLKSGSSFDDYFRYMRDKTYRDTEEAVLPPELFGESEGLTPEEAADDDDVKQPTEEQSTEEQSTEEQPTEEQPAEVPIEPATEPMPEPMAAPEPQPEPQPEPVAVPTEEPAKPTPQQPELPEYPTGSEGDDPLLD